MTARRVARWHGRAGSLSVLIWLLFAVVCGAGVATSPEGSTVAVSSGGTALGKAVTPASSAMGVTRPEVRLLAKRTGQPPSMSALAWPPREYRLVAPTGWRTAASVAADRVDAVHGEAYQGRAPPFAA